MILGPLHHVHGPRLTRRAILGSTAALGGAMAVPALFSLDSAKADPPPGLAPPATPPALVSKKLTAFSLDRVTLDPGSVYERSWQELLTLVRHYPLDSLLVTFRLQAGLLNAAEAGAVRVAGGWEGWPDGGIDAAVEQRWGPEYVRGTNKAGASGLLRGHYTGHMLSAFAQAYASTKDETIRDRAVQLVDGLEECREAMAAATNGHTYSHPGFLSAYGEWQFSALEEFAPYGEIWAPYYTLAKILAGLLDVHRYTGHVTALHLAMGIGHWVHSRLSKCSTQQLQRMWAIYIGGEYGGMNDALFDLYVASEGMDDPFGGSRDEFLAAAKLFDNNTLIAACTAHQDALTDLHANQHIPQFIGYAKLGSAGEEPRVDDPALDYHRTAANFWEMIVPGRMYSHGGTGEGEVWGPPNTVAGDIGARNAESCAAYNMLKVSRHLFMDVQDTRYMDYYERTLLNHILGGRSRALSNEGKTDTSLTPGNCYMFPVNPGARKEYGNGNIGTCCGGSALESHTKYQDSVWFRSATDDELWVNLFMPSTLDWDSMGVSMKQETNYPVDEDIRISVASGTGRFAVRVRIPAWAEGARVTSPSSPSQEVVPGAYHLIPTRDWGPGDAVEIHLPLRLRTEATADRRDIQSLFHGPTLLHAIDATTKYHQLGFYGALGLDGSIAHGYERIQNPEGDGDHFRIGGILYEPAHNGDTAEYHMYFQRNEATVVFAGDDTGVANPQKSAGSDAGTITMLDEIWGHAPFPDRRAFISKVKDVSRQWQLEGRISSRDRQAVILSAGKARI